MNLDEEWLAKEILRKSKDPSAWHTQAGYSAAAGNAITRRRDELIQLEQQENDMQKRFEIIGMPEMWMLFSAVMLWAFALEALCKGIIVKMWPEEVRSKNGRVEFPWGTHGHDLEWLVKKTGIEPTKEELELLEILTRVGTWGGKYPVPKNLTQPLELRWSNQQEKTYSSIFNRLNELGAKRGAWVLHRE